MSKLPDAAAVALDNLRQTAWFARLQVVDDTAQAAALIVELAEVSGLAADAAVFWSPGTASGIQPHGTPGGAPGSADLALLRSAVLAAGGVAHAQGFTSICLRASERIILRVRLLNGASTQALLDAMGARLALAVTRLACAMRGETLSPAQRGLEETGHRQCALLAIADVAASALGLRHLLRGVHHVLGSLLAESEMLVVRCAVPHARGGLPFASAAMPTTPAGVAAQNSGGEGMVQVLYHSRTDDGSPVVDTALHSMPVTAGSPLWQVLRQGETLVWPSPQARPGADGAPWVSQGSGLAVPLRHGARLAGALLVSDPAGTARYSAELRQLVVFAASQIQLTLERRLEQADGDPRGICDVHALEASNHQLRQQLLAQHRTRKVQDAVLRLAQLGSAGLDENTFYQRSHALLGNLLDARNFSIALQSDDASRLEFRYCVSGGKRQLKTRVNGRGLSEYVLRRGEPVLLQRAHIERLREAGEISAETGRDTESWLGVPLCHAGDVVGVMAVSVQHAGATFAAADEALLAALAPQVADAILRRRELHALRESEVRLERQVSRHQREWQQQCVRRQRAHQQLEHQLLHDQLTGLPNQWALRMRLDQVLELVRATPGRSCALLCLDVDRFKLINGSLGHVRGDAVLKEVGRRLLASVGEQAMVARLPGDEFAILLERVEAPGAALEVAQAALAAVNATLVMAGEELSPSVSIGVAVADGGGAQADELQRHADVALHRAKRLGRHRVELFSPAWVPEVAATLGMESRLRHALQHAEFEPYFQPLRRLVDGKLVGFEALLRWHHPQRGLLLPQEFLGTAEDCGLIEAIDWQIFELGCRRLAEDCPADTFLTINVSGQHLGRADFASRLLALLARTGVARERLIIEVTEGTLLGDPDQVRAVLHTLREQGVGAALDDFGTGYSSLSYLHSLPLCLVKIDQAFVHALGKEDHDHAATIVAAIIALAGGLDMQVIAEGIETQEQLDVLLAMGCSLGQGFLLGRPAAKKRWRDLYPQVLQRTIGKRLLPRARATRSRS